MKPPVPACVDLRGLPYMPLDVNRVRDSQLAISASGDEFRAAVLLWCASWNQIPAASLPDDEMTLAAYAGYGRDVKGWKRIKSGAMRGFVMCDDGRWYHTVVAEKAIEAWEERKDYRDKRDNEAERLKRHREEHRALRKELREYGVTAPWNEKVETLRVMVFDQRLQRTRTVPETSTGASPATAKKGREGKGREDIQQELPATPGAEAPPDPDPIFGHGLAFLRGKGVPERGARSFLGAMRKTCGELLSAELLAKAEREDVSDPIPWLRKAYETRLAGPPKPDGATSKYGKAIEALEQMKSGHEQADTIETATFTLLGSGGDAGG